jgi:glyoxylase-like metal-dependent hydrolase (beta-lactamase superfamily II)
LHHFSDPKILVSGGDYRLASGYSGRLLGYLPHRWPKWFSPTPVAFEAESFGTFDQSYKITKSGDVVIVPTPGHTPGHVSVLVESEDVIYFLAGDTSYSQKLLAKRIPDGVSPRAGVTLDTMDRILALAQYEPLIYLPSHDPESVDRLSQKHAFGEPVRPQLDKEAA